MHSKFSSVAICNFYTNLLKETLNFIFFFMHRYILPMFIISYTFHVHLCLLICCHFGFPQIDIPQALPWWSISSMKTKGGKILFRTFYFHGLSENPEKRKNFIFMHRLYLPWNFLSSSMIQVTVVFRNASVQLDIKTSFECVEI